MIAEWIGQTPSFLVALSLLVLPGLPVGLCLRGVRGVVRVAVAVAVSLGVLAAASLVAPMTGMRWGLLPVVAVTLSVWVITAVLRLLDRRPIRALQVPGRRAVWVAIGLAFVWWTLVLAYGIGSPDHPTQLYDGLFHLNAVGFIAQTGDASPLHMTMVLPNQDTSFYPTLWHALVSLVVPSAGSIVAATNVTTIAVVAVLWPIAVTSLTAVALPGYPVAAAWAPLATAGFSVFPLGFLNWGVLYPNLLGMLVVPILLVTVLLAFASSLSLAGRTLRILVVLAATAATALGHPSALLGAVAILAPYLVWRAWLLMRAGAPAAKIAISIAVLLGLVLMAAVWAAANVTTDEWLPTATLGQAVGEVAFLSPVARSTGLLLGPLAAVGIWRVVKDRTWWILGSYGVSIFLFLMSTWFPVLSIRSAFVGVWYDDTTRVAALLAVWGLPLAALGASVTIGWLVQLWQKGRKILVAALALVLVIAAASHLLAVRNDVQFMRAVSFEFGEASQGLSPDEVALFNSIDNVLTDDSLVIADPLTGAGLLYAYIGEDVVFPHVTGRYGNDAALLARYLVDGGPEVCEAIERMGVTHALDFGDTVLFENHYTTYSGLHDLESSPILSEVDRVGDAVLYEVTGCE